MGLYPNAPRVRLGRDRRGGLGVGRKEIVADHVTAGAAVPGERDCRQTGVISCHGSRHRVTVRGREAEWDRASELVTITARGGQASIVLLYSDVPTSAGGGKLRVEGSVRVKDAMSTDLLVVGTAVTVAEAARLMLKRRVGAAVVVDERFPGPGIITERDVMRALADGRDPEATPVEACMTFEARTATTNWDLDTAAEEMINGHFRHLLVVDEQGRMVGIVSMRDIVGAHIRAAHASEAPAAADTPHS
jgi:CBS domain-containing protein